MTQMLLAVGTRKGLFLGRSDGKRDDWAFDGPIFPMNAVYAVAIDTRRQSPRLLVGAMSEHWGPSVFTSDDLGKTWDEPEHGAVVFPAETEATLEQVWQLTPGLESEPDVVWAGVEPSALFKSTDGGKHFELVQSLWDHPHRPQWTPGGGGKAIHTVLPHPDDPSDMTVAMSTGGVYRSTDGCRSWSATNSGIKVAFLPDPEPEFGQCVHKVARQADRPDQLFLQHHHGVYRSDDRGEHWTRIDSGLPADFGFPIVAHPRRAGVAYVFPLVADAKRIPPDGCAQVWRTEDAGESWAPAGKGLPSEHFYSTVLRDAMCADDGEPTGIYLGTRGGALFGSRDEGETWRQLAGYLPDVECVRAATVG